MQNIDRVLERGERLDGLVERTNLLRFAVLASSSLLSMFHGLTDWKLQLTLLVCSCQPCANRSEHAQMFTQASTKLRRDLWWQAVRMKLFIVALIAFGIVAVAFAICGWGLQTCV